MSDASDALAAAAQAMMDTLRVAASDPADAIRLLATLVANIGQPPAAVSDVGALATAALFRRSALVSIALATADYQPASSTEADAVIDQVAALLDAEIVIAADAGDDASFSALRDVRQAVVADLQARSASLPELIAALPTRRPQRHDGAGDADATGSTDRRACGPGHDQQPAAQSDRDSNGRANNRPVSAECITVRGERWAAGFCHAGVWHLMRPVQDTHRRVLNSVAFGRTTGAVFVDTDGLPKVQVRLSPIELKVLTFVQGRGLAKNMPVGTPVVALFQGGDRSNGVITASTDPGNRPAMAGDEDAALYGYGFSIIVASDGVHITAPDVWFSGNVHVVGEVTAKAGTGASVTLSQHKGHNGGGQPPTPGT